MSNQIKNKTSDPFIQEFATNDLFVNINEGTLFYRSKNELFRLEGRKVETFASDFGGQTVVSELRPISASIISTSGFIIGEDYSLHLSSAFSDDIPTGTHTFATTNVGNDDDNMYLGWVNPGITGLITFGISGINAFLNSVDDNIHGNLNLCGPSGMTFITKQGTFFADLKVNRDITSSGRFDSSNFNFKFNKKLIVDGDISGSIFISGPTTTDEGGQLTMLHPIGGTHDWMIDNYQNRCRIFREDAGGGGGSEVLSVTNNDRLGISDSSPSTKLDVNGTVTCTGFNNTSDIKLKTDINNIETPLETIQKLKGITFNWKNDIIETDKSLQGIKHGFIAQEVEKVLPSLVFEDKNKSINYIELIPILVESIKDQQKQINELKSRINYGNNSIR